MGTKNNPSNICDCYAKAEPDEPMFVLLGRDKHAPTLVWLWATLRELDGENPATVKEARECALTMIQWAHAHGRKVCGLGVAQIAGAIEMIRVANAVIKASKTEPTSMEIVRQFLCATEIEPSELLAGGKEVTRGEDGHLVV